jgi:tetratricopeptide (TPR) repeat protein/DNA-binding XRE family transcriptional regulator
MAAGQEPVSFGELLRWLRVRAGLTQEELAHAARVSPRSVSDLERGVNQTAHKDTAQLLADALGLRGPGREKFEAAARGRVMVGGHTAAWTAAAGWSAGRGSTATATRTLPRDVGSFTGRELEMQQLVTAAAGADVVGIHAIGGMAGIGKTAFAVHAAHQLAPQFPDGQIFLSLHGHTPGQRPVDPSDALASLLLTAGVGAQQIPPGLEARIALWRDHLVGKQLLLVLDDAVGHQQVRPLLPGTVGSLVLVTSRRHLTALEDAHAISLDTLAPDEAAALLVRLANRTDLDPADPAVHEIARLCGFLPLAVGMLARQLHHHPAWSPADLAADLAAARDRLELMVTESLSVAAAFGLSYADLTEGQQRLFHRLGLHPGAGVDAYAAAALDDIDVPAARRHLEALYDQHLLTEPARGRYHMHDLIREHARALAADDPIADTDAATGRLLDYYQHAAEAADRRLSRHTRPGAALSSQRAPQVAVPDLPDAVRALSWARAERANLLACLDQATHDSQDVRVVALTAAIAALLRYDGPWTDAIARHTTAAQAARRLVCRPGEAAALHDLGDVRYLAGDYRAAATALEAALEIYRELGDRLGQANTLTSYGSAMRLLGDYSAAVTALEAALEIYRELGDRLGQANTLTSLGVVRYATSAYPDAAAALEAALEITRYLGDRLAQARALMFLGMVRRMTGEYQVAVAVLEEALKVGRDLGNRSVQVGSLNELGSALRMAGDYPRAAEALDSALDVARDLGDRQGQANAIHYRGVIWTATGDYPQAAQALDAALGIYRDIGDRGGEMTALNEAGVLHLARGDPGQAERYYRQALGMAREMDVAWDEAHALAGLGRCALAASRAAEARADLQRAQEIFKRIGTVEASEIAVEIAALSADGPGQRVEQRDGRHGG